MFRTPLADGPPERHVRKPGLGSRLRQAVSGQANASATLPQTYVTLPLDETGPDDSPAAAEGDPGDPLPEGLIRPDGSVDFDQLLVATDLPPVAITAERAAQILSTIPEDLPRRVKRLVVRTSLDTLNDFDGPAAAETARATVRDAEEKSRRIVRVLDRFRAEEEAQRIRIEAEIVALEAEIAARRELLTVAAQRTEEVRKSCQRRTDEFDQVILFFSVEARIRAEGAAAELEPGDGETTWENDAEKPAFLDEQAVMRLLGIARTAAANPAAEEAAAGINELSVMPSVGPRRQPVRPRHTGSLVPP